ncbi:ABC1 kinase family protein [Nitrospira sp. Kam-Ns4a]
MKLRVLAIFSLLALMLGRYLLCRAQELALPARIGQARRAGMHRKNARSFVRTATRLKGVLIKVGQALSARVDILPDAFTDELSQLQDQVPPIEYAAVRQRIAQELGDDPDRIFASFTPTPIAAASLGQVHAACLLDGRRVAVKVQYPGIAEIVATDLRALEWATRLLRWWMPSVRFDLLYDEFRTILLQELDYEQEARYAEAFRIHFADDARIVVPRVIWAFTTPRVLTLEFVEGIKISHVAELEAKGVQLPALARLVVEAYMRQLLRHRLFHADPHPGNLFVQPHPEGPRLVFVDFGIMQPMGPQLYQSIKGAMRAIVERDIPGIVYWMKELGVVVRTARDRDVEAVAAALMERYRDKPPKELRALTLEDIARDLRELFRVYPYLQLPNHFVVLGRTAGMLSGLNAQLDPDLNLIELAAPYVREFFLAEEGPPPTLLEQALAVGKRLAGLPRLVESRLAALEQSESRRRVSSEALAPLLDRLYGLLFRAAAALVAVVAFALWVWLRLQGASWEAHLLAAVAGVAALLLLGSWLTRTGRA